ncbi:hypothetical protein ES703_84342 [subsurface metagenome]
MPQITVAFAVCVAFIILIAGCEGENLSDTKSNIEKSRLIAVENIQLKKEVAKQKKLLDKCLRKKKALQEKPQEEGESPTKFLFEENLRLDKENKNLKAQVQQLEARVRQLEKELQEIKRPEQIKVNQGTLFHAFIPLRICT